MTDWILEIDFRFQVGLIDFRFSLTFSVWCLCGRFSRIILIYVIFFLVNKGSPLNGEDALIFLYLFFKPLYKSGKKEFSSCLSWFFYLEK